MTDVGTAGGHLYTARDGLVVLGPELVQAMELLERRFTEWAYACGAVPMTYPVLMRTTDLASLDYFDNFPHLALLAAPLRVGPSGAEVPQDGIVPGERLGDSVYALASAACYNVYLHARGDRLTDPRYVTTVARCFRNEDHYDGLRRLHGFTMREIVCVGSREAVQAHLAAFKPKVAAYAQRLGLKLEVQAASDPFFAKDGGRALMAQLFPVKEEFVHDGSLAIASLNFHRNFFGERCDIALPDGSPAFSGCVAFGLERWLAALIETRPDIDDVLAALAEAARD